VPGVEPASAADAATNAHASGSWSAIQIDKAPPLQPVWQYPLLLWPLVGQQ
jgi:hypothetical protein